MNFGLSDKLHSIPINKIENAFVKDELEKLLDEERKQSRETSQQCVAATREEMKEYLQEQRKVSDIDISTIM